MKCYIKPEGIAEQVGSLWEFCHNHLNTKLTFLDWQVKFLILVVLGLLAAILTKM